MKFIDKLHGMADEVVEAVQWPFRRRSIGRAFDSVIDKSESEKLRVETAITEHQRNLTKSNDEDEAKGIIKKIVALRIELEEAERIAVVAAAEKAKLFDAEAEA